MENSQNVVLLLFLDKLDYFASKTEDTYNPKIEKALRTINGISHQLFRKWEIQIRSIYPELKNFLLQGPSNVTWKELLTTKFRLRIERHSSTDDTLHRSGRAVEKSSILLQMENVV